MSSYNVAAADDLRVPGRVVALRVIDVTDAIVAADTPRTVAGKWLFRLLSEPRRLWRRYLIGSSVFLWLLTREALTGSAIPPDGDVGGRDKMKRGVTL